MFLAYLCRMYSTDKLWYTFYNFSMGIKKIQNEIGRRLKTLRLEKNFTQEEVAFAVKVSRDHLSNIENGKYPINIKNLYKLAVFFNVEMKYFFE